MISSLEEPLSEIKDQEIQNFNEESEGYPLRGKERPSYKTRLQDLENILKGKKVSKGIDFLPTDFKMLSPNMQQDAVVDGYKRFWDSFGTMERV